MQVPAYAPGLEGVHISV